jgi:hypothetical protein
MHAQNIYLRGGVAYTRVSWRRRGGLIGIFGFTWSLRPRGWARDNGEQAADEKILIRDGAVMVIVGSETCRPGSLLVLKKSVAAVECKLLAGDRLCGTYR